ncbi:MAG: Hint domain-containing protein, partial [Myxococcota bacterium]
PEVEPARERTVVAEARGMPSARFHAERCGGWLTLGEYRLPEPLDPRIETLVVLWSEAGDEVPDVPCQGEAAFEVRAAELEAYASSRTAAVRLAPARRLEAPLSECGHSYTWTVCGRDAHGDFYAASDWQHGGTDGQVELPMEYASFVRTPSGNVLLHDLVRGQEVVSPSGVGRIRFVRPYAHRREVRLFFADGSRAAVPSNIEVKLAGGGFQRANTLEAGDEVLRFIGNALTPTPVIEAAPATPYTSTLEVDGDGTLLIDDVLVRATPNPRATDRPSLRVTSDEILRVRPLSPQGCDLQGFVQFDLDALPADVESLALRYARSTAAPGALSELACEDALPWTELPMATARSLPTDSQGRRFFFSDIMNDEGSTLGTGDRVECESHYAVLACYRTQDGSLRSVPGAVARSVQSGPYCFAAGTQVSTPNGPRPIETLRPGGVVFAWQDGERIETYVRGVIPRGPQNVRALSLSNGHVMRVTDAHPLYSPDALAYRPAEHFRVGDSLLGEDGTNVRIVDIQRKDPTLVFDLSVGGPHNYFAEGVLAHNY